MLEASPKPRPVLSQHRHQPEAQLRGGSPTGGREFDESVQILSVMRFAGFGVEIMPQPGNCRAVAGNAFLLRTTQHLIQHPIKVPRPVTHGRCVCSASLVDAAKYREPAVTPIVIYDDEHVALPAEWWSVTRPVRELLLLGRSFQL